MNSRRENVFYFEIILIYQAVHDMAWSFHSVFFFSVPWLTRHPVILPVTRIFSIERQTRLSGKIGETKFTIQANQRPSMTLTYCVFLHFQGCGLLSIYNTERSLPKNSPFAPEVIFWPSYIWYWWNLAQLFCRDNKKKSQPLS